VKYDHAFEKLTKKIYIHWSMIVTKWRKNWKKGYSGLTLAGSQVPIKAAPQMNRGDKI